MRRGAGWKLPDLFAGLTAYDTQKIKSIYAYVAGTDMMGKTVVMGALSLYLDFINIFLFLVVIAFVWLAKPPFGAKAGAAAAGGH